MTARKLVSLIAFAFLLPGSASAAILYQQGSLPTGDRGAYQYFGQELADDFVALSSGALTSATWTGSYYGAVNLTGSESFTFNLFGGGAAPGSLLYSFSGNASFVASATPTYFNYTLNLAGPVLSAGTQYWASIYSNSSPSNYAWANSSSGSSDGAFRNSGGVWMQLDGSDRSNHIFTLNSVTEVPEPGVLSILGLGLLGLGLTRRLRKKAA